jgi:Predicted transmembrane transcriptional regulator (anti-sigma factor)
MNICDKAPLYLYNEMNEQEKQEFEAHLRTCQECENSVKIFGAMQASLVMTSAPLQTINSVFSKTSRKKNYPLSKGWKISFAAAACLLIGICSFSLQEQKVKSDHLYSYYETQYDIEELDTLYSELDEFEKYSIF